MHLAGATLGVTLQVVPVVDSFNIYSTGAVQLRGRGFQEGNGTTYRFGGGQTVDANFNDGPDVFGGFLHDNDAVNLGLPVGGFGTYSVTTAGGTSAQTWNVLYPGLGDLPT